VDAMFWWSTRGGSDKKSGLLFYVVRQAQNFTCLYFISPKYLYLPCLFLRITPSLKYCNLMVKSIGMNG
jgi:hypothetical protein